MKKLTFMIMVCVLLLASCTTVDFTDDFAKLQQDDTEYLQNLLNSSGDVVIPKNPSGLPWITNRLYLKNTGNKTITFEKDCVVLAKPGEFHKKLDMLIEISNCKNITINGYGATLKMRKKDYRSARYVKSQWRHTIAIFASENIHIEGLKLTSSGGDGVYIGYKNDTVVKNVTLKNMTIEDSHRQGVSVISVDGFLMEGCSVYGTNGTSPKSGIDFEPNENCFGFQKCLIKDCYFMYNKGYGIHIYLRYAEPNKFPVDITIENCVSAHNGWGAFTILAVKNGVKGKVTVKNCDFRGVQLIKIPASFTLINKQ